MCLLFITEGMRFSVCTVGSSRERELELERRVLQQFKWYRRPDVE